MTWVELSEKNRMAILRDTMAVMRVASSGDVNAYNQMIAILNRASW